MTRGSAVFSRSGKAGAGTFAAAGVVLVGAVAAAPLLLTLMVAGGAGLLVAGGVAAAAIPALLVGAWRLRHRREVPGLAAAPKSGDASAPPVAGSSPVLVAADSRKDV